MLKFECVLALLEYRRLKERVPYCEWFMWFCIRRVWDSSGYRQVKTIVDLDTVGSIRLVVDMHLDFIACNAARSAKKLVACKHHDQPVNVTVTLQPSPGTDAKLGS